MIRKSLLLVAPLALGLATSANAAPPAAAPKPLVLSDLTGDANLVNNQGFPTVPVVGAPVPIPSGTKTEPASYSAFDIKSLTVAATGNMATRKVGRKKVKYFNCTGYTATLEMSGAPLLNGSLYRVKGTTPAHATYWLEFSNELDGKTRTTLRYTDSASTLGTTSIDIAPAKIDGNKIIWTVTAANVKASGEAVGKTVITGWGSDVRNNAKANGTGATVPMWDELPVSDAAAWKVCPV